jgi:hypothetical protein
VGAGGGDDLARLVDETLARMEGDAEAAAEWLMLQLGGGVHCLVALERLGDLVDEARRLAAGPEQVDRLLRLRVTYRPEGGE